MNVAELNAALGLPATATVIDFEWYHPILAGVEHAGLVKQARLGPAFTLIYQGRVVACWGLIIHWPGLAEAWMITTPALKPIAAPFTYASRRFLAIAAQSLALRRIQIHVQTSNGAALAWARAARFKQEAKLEAYDPMGGDVYVMTRIFR